MNVRYRVELDESQRQNVDPAGRGRQPPSPKHASWLHMVEIEIGVLVAQCLARRILDVAALTTEVEGWAQARDAAPAECPTHL